MINATKLDWAPVKGSRPKESKSQNGSSTGLSGPSTANVAKRLFSQTGTPVGRNAQGASNGSSFTKV